MLVFPAPSRDLAAPLGLAFIDLPSGAPVADGLSVAAWREGREDRRVFATVNGDGVAGFLKLPGVVTDPANPFANPKPFVVEVADPWNRFLTGRVVVPAPAKGVALVPMRSAPGRPVPPGLLALRAELWDATNDRPAAFALLTVRLAPNGAAGGAPGAVVATGLADAAGRVLALGSWPAPKVPAPGGPPVKWDAARPLVVSVQYDPGPPPSVPRLDAVPGLPAASAWHQRGATNVPFTAPDLEAGKPVTLRSSGDGRGRLLVTAP